MLPHISQSSSIEPMVEGDPFEDFSYDPVIIHNISHNGTLSPIPTDQSTGGGRMRKRHSAALSFSATCGPSSTGANQLFEDNRAIKKRQTTSQHKMSHNSLADLVVSPTISSLGDIIHREEDEEETSSIYSRSSLTFSFGAQVTTATRAGSELSLDEEISNTTMNHFFNNEHRQEQCISQQSSPYERPNCPIPGQARINNTPHSNTSTLANSMCSYLTVDNNEELTNVVQPNYFPHQQQSSSSSA